MNPFEETLDARNLLSTSSQLSSGDDSFRWKEEENDQFTNGPTPLPPGQDAPVLRGDQFTNGPTPLPPGQDAPNMGHGTANISPEDPDICRDFPVADEYQPLKELEVSDIGLTPERPPAWAIPEHPPVCTEYPDNFVDEPGMVPGSDIGTANIFPESPEICEDFPIDFTPGICVDFPVYPLIGTFNPDGTVTIMHSNTPMDSSYASEYELSELLIEQTAVDEAITAFISDTTVETSPANVEQNTEQSALSLTEHGTASIEAIDTVLVANTGQEAI